MGAFAYLAIFVVSLAVLLKASDLFINAAEKIGLSLGISPFIIGVTIIAFGTSLPELATSIASVLEGQSEIVVGNVVGSNITNIALVLGLTAAFTKRIELQYNIWHIDMPFLWGSAFLLWLTLLDLKFTLGEGVLFSGGIILFLTYSFQSDKEDPDAADEMAEKEHPKTTVRTYGQLILGGVFVWLGADYTIYGIVGLSTIAGINPEIIALSAVAVGTSLPEVIVSLSAARRGNAAMAVGNVLGSNIFNTYAVMSIPSFFAKGGLVIPASINDFYLPLMLVLTVLFGVTSNNKKITRWEGVMLLFFYAFFMMQLFTTA